MRCAGASGDVTGGSNVLMLNLIGGSTVVCELEQIIFGASGTPADAVAKFAIVETSTAGTGGSSKSAFNLDRNGGSPQATLKNGYSANPTLSNNIFELDVNQRATFAWPVPPGLRSKLTANYGLAVVMLSGPAVAWNVSFVWTE